MSNAYRRWHYGSSLVERKRYVVAEVAGVLGTALLLGAAGYGAVSAMQGAGDKSPEPSAPAPLPTAPSPDTSLADAQKQADERRKTILQSGGQTVLTQQGMPGTGTGAAGKTLLGS